LEIQNGHQHFQNGCQIPKIAVVHQNIVTWHIITSQGKVRSQVRSQVNVKYEIGSHLGFQNGRQISFANILEAIRVRDLNLCTPTPWALIFGLTSLEAILNPT